MAPRMLTLQVDLTDFNLMLPIAEEAVEQGIMTSDDAIETLMWFMWTKVIPRDTRASDD